jgi:urease accessory protein
VGAPAARITREEFVTPPEFRGLESVQHPAARVGGARIELIRSGAETRLGTCYQQIPVRVMPPFSFDAEPAALLYLINLTAGLMDGDSHLMEIVARPGTRAVVTGQSASRIHPALNGFARQQWVVDVQEDACLVVLPGPTIPYQGTRFYQRGRARLASTARLIWGDVWLPGRHERGTLSEKFQFERIIQDFEVHREGRLIYRDRFRWDGPWTDDDVRWYWGGHMACGSLFVTGATLELASESAPDFRRSVFQLDTGDTCIRWCGTPNAVTADLVQTSLQLAAVSTSGPDAPPWLLTSTSLAPNHWFSTPAA